MSYNPLYGSVPYLKGGSRIGYLDGGQKVVKVGSASPMSESEFAQLVADSNDSEPADLSKLNKEAKKVGRGWTLSKIGNAIVGRLSNYGTLIGNVGVNEDIQRRNVENQLRGYLTDEQLKDFLDGKVNAATLGFQTGMVANPGFYMLMNQYKEMFGNGIYSGGSGSGSGVETITGDTNPNAEENAEEEAPEQEEHVTGGETGGSSGGSTGSTGSGPAEVGEIGSSQGSGQQAAGYDLDALQQVLDEVHGIIDQHNQQLAAQQQQQQQPAPAQPQYRIGVGDLLGMDRWQRRQLHRGRNVRLANGEWVNPTSRWSGRHLAHDIRTERKHGRRDARRDYLAQYYNPARKARYDSRRANRADREASHYVNIGQYVLPYENATA